MKRWIARLLLPLLALPLLLAAAEPEAMAPLSPLSPRKVTLVICGLPPAAGIGYQMAIEKGFYRCRGLDVSLVYRDAALTCGPGGVERNGDFIVAPLLLALKWRARDGMPLVHLTQVVNRSTQVLVGWKHRGITKPESLDKRRIALPLGTSQLAGRTFFEQSKINPQVVGLSERGCAELFVQQRIDAAQFSDYAGMPQLYLYGIDREELMVISLHQDASLDIPEDGLYCREELWQQRPEVCQKMREATQEGWRYIVDEKHKEHREEAAAVLFKNSQKAKAPMNLTQAELTIRALMPALTASGKLAQRSGELSPATLKRAVDFLIGQKIIPAETEIGIADFCRRK
jgi:NitT/TauT family transport system substrate-binding protein